MRIDLKALKKKHRENEAERLRWIDFYAAWVRRHPEKVFGKGQTVVTVGRREKRRSPRALQ